MSIVDLLTEVKYISDIDCITVTLLCTDLIIAKLPSIDCAIVTLPTFAEL